MLKTTDLGRMFVNLRRIKTDRQLIQEVYFHTVQMYTNFVLTVRREGRRIKGVLLEELPISIIHLTPGCAELSLRKTGQVVKFI